MVLVVLLLAGNLAMEFFKHTASPVADGRAVVESHEYGRVNDLRLRAALLLRAVTSSHPELEYAESEPFGVDDRVIS